MKTAIFFLLVAGTVSALGGTIIADWTFETSQPTTAGSYSPEVGSGSASGVHASSSTVWSSPTGNGSAHSFGSDHWAVNDYWQFSVSTIGYEDILLSWDQTSSGSGPGLFGLFWSNDGSTFHQVGANYSVLGYNVSPNPNWSASMAHPQYSFSSNLSAIADLDNALTVYFRLVDGNTTSASGGTVGTAGADRVDNFTVTGTLKPQAVPESLPTGCQAVPLVGMVLFSRWFADAVRCQRPVLARLNRAAPPQFLAQRDWRGPI